MRSKKENPTFPAELAGGAGSVRFIKQSNLTTAHSNGQQRSILTDNSANSQRLAILSYLTHHGAMTTLQARQELGICHPAARVMELRQRGYQIDMVWVVDIDSAGQEHRVARYILNNNQAIMDEQVEG